MNNYKSFSETSGNVMYLGISRAQAFATATRGDARTDNEGSDTTPLTLLLIIEMHKVFLLMIY